MDSSFMLFSRSHISPHARLETGAGHVRLVYARHVFENVRLGANSSLFRQKAAGRVRRSEPRFPGSSQRHTNRARL